jgi:hypothetical protein
VLRPAKKNVKDKADEGSAADPPGLSIPQDTGQQREKDDSGENQVNNKDKIPGKPMSKKR